MRIISPARTTNLLQPAHETVPFNPPDSKAVS